MPTFERMKITDKKVNKTSKLVQEFFKAVYREEFSPFVNLEVKILPIRANPDGLSSEPIQSVGIKLIVKANKACSYSIYRKDRSYSKRSSCHSTRGIIGEVNS